MLVLIVLVWFIVMINCIMVAVVWILFSVSRFALSVVFLGVGALISYRLGQMKLIGKNLNRIIFCRSFVLLLEKRNYLFVLILINFFASSYLMSYTILARMNLSQSSTLSQCSGLVKNESLHYALYFFERVSLILPMTAILWAWYFWPANQAHRQIDSLSCMLINPILSEEENTITVTKSASSSLIIGSSTATNFHTPKSYTSLMDRSATNSNDNSRNNSISNGFSLDRNAGSEVFPSSLVTIPEKSRSGGNSVGLDVESFDESGDDDF